MDTVVQADCYDGGQIPSWLWLDWIQVISAAVEIDCSVQGGGWLYMGIIMTELNGACVSAIFHMPAQISMLSTVLISQKPAFVPAIHLIVVEV